MPRKTNITLAAFAMLGIAVAATDASADWRDSWRGARDGGWRLRAPWPYLYVGFPYTYPALGFPVRRQDGCYPWRRALFSWGWSWVCG